MKPAEKKPDRKPYKSPVLEKYGDIRKLTKQIGKSNMNDPGGSSTTMTG
ncbi:MAG: lasso RiPP family leader peptide-containing protein [Usitatibacter sp.]